MKLEGVLSGIRVLDLTQNVAGPFCSQTLGDLGADVIKVERPGTGDDSRSWHSPVPGGVSAHFVSLNRNKRSICVNLAEASGHDVVRRIAAGCDVFLHSMKPASAAEFGFGYERLAASNPSLVYCAVSAYGEDGPLKDQPGYDPVIQAFSGLMSLCGNPTDEPSRVPVSIIDIGTGMWAALGIVSACMARLRTGRGSRVQVSLLETSISWMSALVTAYSMSGQVPGRIGTALSNAAPYELFRAQDGYVLIAAPNDRLFGAVCRALSIESVAHHQKFQTNALRLANRSELHRLMEQHTADYTVSELVATLRSGGVPCGEVNNLAQALVHPQVQAADMLGKWSQPSPLPSLVEMPIRMDGERSQAREAPPALGEHTDQILSELQFDEKEISDLRARGVVA